MNTRHNHLTNQTIELDTVVLVANSGGLALLIENSPHRDVVETLQERGVQFRQCRNTFSSVDTTEHDLIDGVELVSSGVGESATSRRIRLSDAMSNALRQKVPESSSGRY